MASSSVPARPGRDAQATPSIAPSGPWPRCRDARAFSSYALSIGVVLPLKASNHEALAPSVLSVLFEQPARVLKRTGVVVVDVALIHELRPPARLVERHDDIAHAHSPSPRASRAMYTHA